MIISGEARLRQNPAKPGDIVMRPQDVTLKRASRWVSRSAEKLNGALDDFGVDPRGHVCLDVGSSTGGFTQVLLERGAKLVFAIDVGKGLLDIRLRTDPRVRVLEETNFRLLSQDRITDVPTLAAVDVSFISLAKILPNLAQILPPAARAVVLVKPQFEGSPKEVPEGFVRDEATRQTIIQRAARDCETHGFKLMQQAEARIAGRRGNQESVFLLERTP